MSHTDAIKRNYDVLLRCTTINYYVIDFLRAEDVLNETQEYDLKTKRNPLKQRILLLQWLKEISIPKYESFLQVMEDTEQEHVANLLRGSNEEDHLPLSDERHTRLVKIRHKIANVIRIDNEMIAELRSSNTISRTDAEEIRAEKVDYTRISKLISAIMRRSNHCYKSFQEALRKTLQMAAADFLSEGEMPEVHVTNNRSDLDGPLSSALNHAIMNRTTADTVIRELLAQMTELGIDPVIAIPGSSIVIFIYCKTVQNAVIFTRLFNSGRLQRILEGILNQLLRTIEPNNADTLDSRISLEDEESVTLEEFTGIEGWMGERFPRPKSEDKKYRRNVTTQTGEESFMRTQSDLENELDQQWKEAELRHQRTQVQSRRKGLDRYFAHPTIDRTITSEDLKINSKGINGLTILDKELFVASQGSLDVTVYELVEFRFVRKLKLENLADIQDIVSCNRNHFIYILNLQGPHMQSEIVKVDPNGEVRKRWPTTGSWGFLSVTNQSNVIFSSFWGNRLVEFSPDGDSHVQIDLSKSGILHPYRAIKLTNGHFLVSNGHRDDTFHRVCIIDKDGIIVKASGDMIRCPNYKMKHPVDVIVDGDGFVLVSDQLNKRVLLLDEDLQFRRELLTDKKHKIRAPWKILLDESSGRLLVAENTFDHEQKVFGNGQLHIFYVK